MQHQKRWKEANEFNKKYYELEKEVQSEDAKKQAVTIGQRSARMLNARSNSPLERTPVFKSVRISSTISCPKKSPHGLLQVKVP
jgi:hypothetical protein